MVYSQYPSDSDDGHQQPSSAGQRSSFWGQPSPSSYGQPQSQNPSATGQAGFPSSPYRQSSPYGQSSPHGQQQPSARQSNGFDVYADADSHTTSSADPYADASPSADPYADPYAAAQRSATMDDSAESATPGGDYGAPSGSQYGPIVDALRYIAASGGGSQATQDASQYTASPGTRRHSSHHMTDTLWRWLPAAIVLIVVLVVAYNLSPTVAKLYAHVILLPVYVVAATAIIIRNRAKISIVGMVAVALIFSFPAITAIPLLPDIPYFSNPSTETLTQATVSRDSYSDSDGDSHITYELHGMSENGAEYFSISGDQYSSCWPHITSTSGRAEVSYLPHSRTVLTLSCSTNDPTVE